MTRHPGRLTLLSTIVAAALIALGFFADRHTVALDHLGDVAFAMAVAVAMSGAGWLAGAAVLALHLLRPDPFDLERAESLAVCVILFTSTGIARTMVRRLQASRAELTALIAPMQDVILELDRDGTYLDVAPTNPALLFRPLKELRGRRIHDIFPRADADAFVEQIHRALELRQTIHYEYEIVIDGARTWFTAAVTPISDTAVLWVARDFTARKKAEDALREVNCELERRVEERTRDLKEALDALHAEVRARTAAEDERHRRDEALRRSERQLAEAQRIARIGSWEADLRTGEVWWSDEHYRLFGLEPGRPVTFDLFLSLIDERSRKKILENLARLQEEGFLGYELSVGQPDGSVRHLICDGRAVREDGRVVRLVGFVQDVTERKEAERRLRESEERFRLVARAANDAVWDWDIVRDAWWWSDGYGQIFGYGSDDRPRDLHSVLDRVHPDDRARVHAGLRHAIDAGFETWSDEYRYRRADGSSATVTDRGLIIRNARREPVRMIGALSDVTARKELEEQLAQTRRVSSLGRLAASIAHEFNNVLMGIQPNVEVIRRRSTSEVAAPVEHIIRAVRRGKRVTQEILRFTRSEEPDLKCVEVGPFVTHWAAEVRPLLGPAVALEIHVEPELHMLADALQMNQVLTNLAMNGRDAMPEGGTLSIRAELGKSFSSLGHGITTPDAFVHMTCRDTGVGIAQEQLSHIFEPLYTTKKDGTGLGLAISHQIVMRHGGYIFVESKAGAGSTFHVVIPATHPVVAELETSSTAKDVPADRILLVEDDSAVAAGIRMLLESDGRLVEIVDTGNGAVPAIERFAPDVVVLDIGLPDRDGTDVYREIASRWPDLPVLFSSGHGDAERLKGDLRNGRVGFILKPYDFDALQEALAPLLRAKG